jgi:zinc finger CCCH domain-containing protein 13
VARLLGDDDAGERARRSLRGRSQCRSVVGGRKREGGRERERREERERERERERETERERQRDRERDRQRDRETDRKTFEQLQLMYETFHEVR